MFNLLELEQLIDFAELGTLSKVAEMHNISSPSLSRAMQHLEDDFGVILFNRSANKITLNETGLRAVEAARKIIKTSKKALLDVRLFDQSLKTISIYSVAPAPLWKILPKLATALPNKLLKHQIIDTNDVLSSIEAEEVSLAILPYLYTDNRYSVKELITEQLYIAVRPDHKLANKKKVSFKDINGYNFLIRSNIGIWDNIRETKMPDSKFLIQSNDFDFDELVRTSSLPRFVTDFSKDLEEMKRERAIIPIDDNGAMITFYLVIVDKTLADINFA